jgi:hypothetical protein
VPGVRFDWDGAEAAGLVVLEGLDELLAGVHHERAVDGELTHTYRPPLDTHRAGTGEDIDQGVEVRPPGQPQLPSGSKGGVQQRDRGVGDAETLSAWRGG